jgi:diguanylate cyclase (GGDEF)-like protein/PAS domain S-box-containing protein
MSVSKPKTTPSISFDQFGDILNNVTEGIIGVNVFGCCSFANPKALEYLGIEDPTQIIGTPVLEHLNFNKDFTQASTLGYMSDLKNNSSSERQGYISTLTGDIKEVSTWQKPLLVEGSYSGSVIGFELMTESEKTTTQPQPTTFDNSTERYKLLIESTQVVLWEFDLVSNHFTFISPQAESIFGYPIRLWYNRDFWQDIIHPLDKKIAIETCLKSNQDCENYELEFRMMKADGDIIYIKDYVSVVKESDQPIALRGIFADVSHQKINEEQSRLSAIVFESADAVIITNKDKEIIQVNNAFTHITGYEQEEVLGKNPSIVSSGKQDQSFYQKMWSDINNNHHWQGEIWNKRKNGEIYAEWLTITPVFDDDNNVCNYVGIFSDISEKKEAEKEIEYKNSHDELTDLPNRATLYRELKSALLQSKKIGLEGALLFLDLDEFKLVNDSMGHKYGDLLLQQVAGRLAPCISTGDLLARLGGDEFAILVPSISHNREQSQRYIKKMSAQVMGVFSQPFDISGRQFHITCSIGISIFPTDNEQASDVLRQADTAMFRAKDAGKNQIQSFTPDMHHRIERHLLIHNELTLAIKNNDLTIHFQPLYDQNEEVITAEALLRWSHKEYGSIPPSEFIPIAEQTGLIIPLGNFVINSVCEYIAKWKEHKNFSLKRIDINVSCQQFEEDDFYFNLKSTLEKYDIPAGILGLELTEEVMAGDIDKIINTFMKVKTLGVHFSIDDFGTGYSSLRYIKRLPIDNLKIDQSFVSDIPHDESDCIMVNTIMAMARQMGLSVTAEGIETVEQKLFLQNLNCDYYQGFLFNKPLCIEDFEKIIL